MLLNCKLIKTWHPPPPHFYINPPFSGLSLLSSKEFHTPPPPKWLNFLKVQLWLSNTFAKIPALVVSKILIDMPKKALGTTLRFVIGNTFFDKRDSHLITYQSGNAITQIDFNVLRKPNLKIAMNIKVIITSEECVPQHKLLTCELQLKTPKPHPKPFSPKFCFCKLKSNKLNKKILSGYSHPTWRYSTLL